MLEAIDLQKRFGRTVALDGACLSVTPGEMVAIVGPSGSGKSTLLHCAAGILRPDAGQVVFEGRRVDAMGEAARSALRRTAFGFVFQFGQLVPELTAAENIALPLMLSGTSRRGALREARRWLAQLDLTEARRSARASCQAARASASPLPARSCTGPGWCSPTSRPARSTRSRARWS